ncbi:MAG: AAA family ATPase [Candidatus Parabeggiatoa sp.]|nr:AAA family ATPase [Candidatus Parabeggiatoa sp.]
MKVEQLEVKNFKGFAHKVIDFSPQFNMLVGDNGTGKTAVLDALAVGIGTLLLGFDGIVSRTIKSQEIHHVDRELGQITTFEPQYPVVVRCRGKINENETLTWERSLSKKGGKTSNKGAKSLIQYAGHCQEQVRQGETIILPLISYYSTGRLWLQKKEKSVAVLTPGSRMLGYVDCLEPASGEKMLMRWFKTMEMAAIQRQVPMKVLEGLRTAIKNCLEGCEAVYYDIQQDGLVTTLADKHSRPAHLLSDGQRTILAMTADIAYRAAVLNPHLGDRAILETPGIVLIDELDLHLHPNWQRKIIKRLRTTFPLIQFIATTHSPTIVQSLQPGEVINLNDYDMGEYYDKSIEDILEWVMGVDNPQRSQRYKDMVTAAKEYYQVLENAKSASPEKMAELERRLDELVAPFSDDVAYHTFLEMERTAAGLGRKHETR